MTRESRRAFLGKSIGVIGTTALSSRLRAAGSATQAAFVCPPCGCSMDGTEFPAPGQCAACGMQLVERGKAEQPCCQDIISKDIVFTSAGVSLAGTLYVRQETTPGAVVVLVHGSGRVERMSALARLLASEGFAVFTYDKRGVGKSQGTYEGFENTSAANLNLLAQDAAAALATTRTESLLSNKPAGFAGISQAGWIIPIAALRSPPPSFMAFWSGPVCTVSEEMHFSKLAEGEPDFWQKHSEHEVAEYMRSVRYRADDTDPRASLSQLSLPALWTFGGQDNSLPVALSIVRLKSLIGAGKKQFEYKVFPSYGHNLADSPQQSSYTFMVDWIRRTVSALMPPNKSLERSRDG